MRVFIKPNLTKILITIIIAISLFLIGGMYFNNPIFLKTGCRPNPVGFEFCMEQGFPEIINYFSLFLFAPIYLLSCLIYKISAIKTNKTFIIIVLFVILFSLFGYFIYKRGPLNIKFINMFTCKVRDGNWASLGLERSKSCYIKLNDYGKECSDGSDCEGECIANENFKPGDLNAKGTCSKYKKVVGCFSFVSKGEAMRALCVD